MLSLARRTARPVARRAQATARRNFAADANPQYEGAEAFVRQYLPKDEHMVAGFLGAYFGIFLLTRIGGSDKEPAAVKAVAATGTKEDMVPSMMSEKFEAWIEQPGNEAVYEKSCEDFDEWIAQPGNEEKYEAQFA